MTAHTAIPVLIAVVPAALLAGHTGAVSIPEPTDLALFAMGVVGLLVGRRAAVKRDDDDIA